MEADRCVLHEKNVEQVEHEPLEMYGIHSEKRVSVDNNNKDNSSPSCTTHPNPPKRARESNHETTQATRPR